MDRIELYFDDGSKRTLCMNPLSGKVTSLGSAGYVNDPTDLTIGLTGDLADLGPFQVKLHTSCGPRGHRCNSCPAMI